MPRYRLDIEYDGTPFLGWQIQADGATVQGRIAEAIQAFCGETVVPNGAGRTDAGVHALGQVAHVDFARDWPEHTVREAINAHLRPDPIAVLLATRVPDTFDARFSATARHYRYRIINRRAPLALERHRAWHVIRPLDEAAMAEGARQLIGNHDFTTFRAAACQAKSPVKTLDRLGLVRSGEVVTFEVSARSFLHNQVRSMVGSLKLVGEGKWQPRDIARALEARDRALCGPLAPPQGLYLVRVDYDGIVRG